MDHGCLERERERERERELMLLNGPWMFIIVGPSNKIFVAYLPGASFSSLVYIRHTAKLHQRNHDTQTAKNFRRFYCQIIGIWLPVCQRAYRGNGKLL